MKWGLIVGFVLSLACNGFAQRHMAEFEVPISVGGEAATWNATFVVDQELERAALVSTIPESGAINYSFGDHAPRPVAQRIVLGGRQTIWRYTLHEFAFDFVARTDDFVLAAEGTAVIRASDPVPPVPSTAEFTFEIAGSTPSDMILHNDVIEVSPGDTDLDGDVDFVDFLAVSANFAEDVNSFREGDLDFDGRVLFSDFLILSSTFGERQASVATPEAKEPLALLVVPMLWFLRRSSR